MKNSGPWTIEARAARMRRAADRKEARRLAGTLGRSGNAKWHSKERMPWPEGYADVRTPSPGSSIGEARYGLPSSRSRSRRGRDGPLTTF
jgi:hypothetical protein